MLLALARPALAIQSGDVVPGEVIVKLKHQDNPNAASMTLARAQSRRQMVVKTAWSRLDMYQMSVPTGQSVESAIQDLESDPDVEYAEPNYYVVKSSTTDGVQQTFSAEQVAAMTVTSYSTPLTGANINGTQVWSVTQGLGGATRPIVAVVDTGIDMTHPVFTQSGAIYTNPQEVLNGVDDDGNGYVDDLNGWNFVAGSRSMFDDDGHGTHVAGAILAVGTDIYTSPVTAAKIRILPLKFLNGNGVGTTSGAIQSIYYAINAGASVINNSWGGSSYSGALSDALAVAYNQGIVIVSAAGNSGSNNDIQAMYPASYSVPNMIAVAAAEDNDYLATFSNYGANSVHIASPGVFILSTLPGGYFGTMSGTSMAAPIVSGTVALMKKAVPSMLGYQLKTLLLAQGTVRAQLNGLVITGSRVEPLNAINAALGATIDSAQPVYNYSTQASRDLASNGAKAGGCGLVTKMAGDITKPGSRPPGPPFSWSTALFLAILSVPVLLILKLRQREVHEKRRYERFKMSSEVRLTVGERELVGSVSSISMGGVQVNTEALLEKGGIVSMKISSPDGKEMIDVSGVIVWSQEKKAYGVAFNNASLETLGHIQTWSKGLKKAS